MWSLSRRRRFLSAADRRHLTCTWPREVQQRALTLARMLRPYEVPGLRKVRVGGAQDGAYVMLDDWQGVETAFSLGVGPNVDWDFAVAERGLPVHQFDGTVDGPPRHHDGFHFHRRMITPTPSEDGETLVGVLDHAVTHRPQSSILKIDIENAEWGVFAHATPDVFDKFSQILCEFHALEHLHLDWHWEEAFRGLSNLKRHFEVVHVHANNAAGVTYIDGRALPFVIEATLVSRARYDTRPGTERFPGRLDRPNDPGKRDYALGRFAL